MSQPAQPVYLYWMLLLPPRGYCPASFHLINQVHPAVRPCLSDANRGRKKGWLLRLGMKEPPYCVTSIAHCYLSHACPTMFVVTSSFTATHESSAEQLPTCEEVSLPLSCLLVHYTVLSSVVLQTPALWMEWGDILFWLGTSGSRITCQWPRTTCTGGYLVLGIAAWSSHRATWQK